MERARAMNPIRNRSTFESVADAADRSSEFEHELSWSESELNGESVYGDEYDEHELAEDV